jgi:deoxyribodipyrimidine photo-lyase
MATRRWQRSDRRQLEPHAADPRPYVYSVEQLEAALTHDALWNAAQRQLARDGWFHNYMRMLWGKKILEWSAHPRDALATMARLMDKYSLDGRDPNSWSGYFWTLGRYDRPWWPERPIFGTVRYMSSENTARKLKVRQYLQRYA